MIPIRLKMRNFMPYKGDALELSFTDIHTACISGKNGSGKSAIIDAITWALWGKTRSKGDDDLVHQGESEMEVEFEFAMGTDLYRIIRKHTKSKTRRVSGRGSLDLFIYSSTSFVTISADTKTQTEQKIALLLHMDYDTFINSAFLRQGHASEFSRQTPSRRKEVLTNILGLQQYDEYEAAARSKARGTQEERGKLETGIGEAVAELEKQSDVEAELALAKTELQHIDQELTASRTHLGALCAEHQKLALFDTQRQQLDKSLVHHEEDITVWQATNTKSQSKIADYQQLVSKQADIEAGRIRLNNARKQGEELSNIARQFYQLKERKSELDREFLKAQAEQSTRCKITEDRISKLEEKTGRLAEFRRELTMVQPRHKELRDLQFFIDNNRLLSKEKNELAAHYKADIEGLKREIGLVQEKLQFLLSFPDNTHCPLCESELGNERITLVQQKLEQDAAAKTTSIVELEQSCQGLASQISKLGQDLIQVEADYKTKNDALVGNIARLNEAIKDVSNAEELLIGERAELTRLTESLARRDYATGIVEQLNKIEPAIANMDYDETRHQAIKDELKNLEEFEKLGRNLDEALHLLPEEQAQGEQAKKMLADIANRKERDRAARDELLAKVAAFPKLAEELTQAETEERNLITRHRESQQRLGSLQERLTRLKSLADKLRERQHQLAMVKRRQAIFDELALAFGKKGVQAMLIETALPEIEDEANRLLARMTNGRMSVTFETQRDTKKGDMAETLDIKIADELGTRNYEMFSGGEAFRIDFAIRIALSRLLARRAGAPLPILIIDEGFGTQDTDGIDKLKEAISSIQTEFKKIIVITHIEELKDAFPVRINVIKTADGSVIEINES